MRELRIRCGYAQRQVANTLRVSLSIISSYETGERTPSTENLLALSYLYRCRRCFASCGLIFGLRQAAI
ncbi:MAG: helix-turn-helix domain-containing protein [Faecousia sp.]